MGIDFKAKLTEQQGTYKQLVSNIKECGDSCCDEDCCKDEKKKK